MAPQNTGERMVILPDRTKMMEKLYKINPCPMSGWQKVFSGIVDSLADSSMRGDGIAMIVYVQVCLDSNGTSLLKDDSVFRREFAEKVIDAICDDQPIRDFAKKYLNKNLLTN